MKNSPLKFIIVTIATLTTPIDAGAADRLRIATEGAFPPWNAMTPAGELVGFEVDLARDLCRRMEADCEIVAQAWDGILPGLQQGRYDAIMAGMAITDARVTKVDFAGPYATEPTVLATRAESPLRDLSFQVDPVDLDNAGPATEAALAAFARGLAGMTVGVQVSTIQAAFVERHLPGIRVREYGKLDEAALDLAADRLDAVLGSRSAVNALRSADAPLVLVGLSFTRGVLGRGVGVAVRKGDVARKTAFDDAIAAAQRDGTVQTLSIRWFGFDVSIHPHASIHPH
ncbi:transporter substrate-binding domain-containing protein (plasmid) [Azospirillum sp. HJ39]|uniref:transporter substrate-binding domain-containing protein n=1 Tax=Azospirillum sp. HJ39 TaxID=3159496 RepID=UPI0035566D71